MKFIYFDNSAAEEIINDRHYQSVEFEQGRRLVAFFRRKGEEFVISSKSVAVNEGEGGYLVNPNGEALNYLVFDLEEAAEILELDDTGILLTVQKTLRFCIKCWAGLVPSKHERFLTNNKAVVFPYPIGLQTALRVSIDRNPDEKRRSKRETAKALLIYKFGSTEGDGPSEVPRVTNFRKASVEYKGTAYSRAQNFLSEHGGSRKLGANALFVTQLQQEDRAAIHENGIENWRRWLTTSQLQFVESPLLVPHRIEGPAGTGKTLCLALKAIKILDARQNEGQLHRSLFVAHSQATKKAIENLVALNGGADYLIEGYEASDKFQTLKITTLHELCAYLLRRDISESELVDRDAYESKLTQKLYAIEAVDRAMEKDFSSHRPFLSQQFINFLETSDRWAIAEMLQHEISVQIKGRSDQDLSKYKKLPRLKIGFPASAEGDKAFIFVMYDEYQKELVASAQFDTDDVVLSAISQLGTPIWRRRRTREGFDSIFIDETHLFNLNELSVFHKLTCSEITQPIAYSVDRSQALGDRGWSDDSFDEVFDPNNSNNHESPTTVRSIFRCSPDIIDLAFSVTASGATLFTNFHNPLTAAVSAFSAEDERKCAKPIYIEYPSDNLMLSDAFIRAESMARSMSVAKADVAIIAFGDETFAQLQAEAKLHRKSIEVIKSRGDIEAVNRARQGGRFVLSAPEFVGGLEFAGVVLVGVDNGRVPLKSSDGGESQAFLTYASHQRLYVAITRAKFQVEILGNRARGLSETLGTAKAAGLIDLSFFEG